MINDVAIRSDTNTINHSGYAIKLNNSDNVSLADNYFAWVGGDVDIKSSSGTVADTGSPFYQWQGACLNSGNASICQFMYDGILTVETIFRGTQPFPVPLHASHKSLIAILIVIFALLKIKGINNFIRRE